MKIAIDTFPAMCRNTGMGYYTKHLISHFIDSPQNEYYLCDTVFRLANVVTLKNLSDAQSFFRISNVPFPFVTLARFLFLIQNIVTAKLTDFNGVDLFFGTNYRGQFKRNLKNVITIHDLAYKYYPETMPESTLRYLKNRLPEIAQKADHLIADSESTKADIIKFLAVSGEKVTAVPLGVSQNFRPVTDPSRLSEIRERYRLPEKMILYLGTIEPRKNISGVLSAYASLCKDSDYTHDLVIAGGMGWKSRTLSDLIKTLGIEKRVRCTGYVADKDLPGLYSAADLFVFPSLYEGFGLPVLEAMACGVPVVTSGVSSLPEVAGDAAVLVDPHSVSEIASGMNRLLSDEGLRRSFREKGLVRAAHYTWKKCAEETLSVFEKTSASA